MPFFHIQFWTAEKVSSKFHLIHDATINGQKEIVRCRVDAFDNSLLHLAGNLGPSSDLHRRSGPALQMQEKFYGLRQLMWHIYFLAMRTHEMQDDI